MGTRSLISNPARPLSLHSALILAGSLGILLSGSGVQAQINRSRPPSPPAASNSGGFRPGGSTSSGNRGSSDNGSSRPDRGRTPDYGGSRSDRGRTPDSTTIGSRGNSSASDRYNKSQEASASTRDSSRSGKHYQSYYPFGYYPYGYYPYGYDPGGYYPGGYYPYPDGYPYPTYPSYPPPRDRMAAAAKYDSPYYYCEDLSSAQYINGSSVILAKPKKLFTPTPEYREGTLRGWRDLGADDYITERNAENGQYRIREGQADDPDLEAALNDIKQSWIEGDVEPLASHLRRETPVAIVLRGKYQYSLEAGDFLEITRAAYNASSNLRFTLDHLHRKADGVYVLTGRHLFEDSRGHDRTVYLSYVLVKVKDQFVITQFASSPDKE